MAPEAKPAGENGENGTPPPPAGTDGGNKTFTQDELDKIVQERLGRATRGKMEPKDFGFETKAELEAALKVAKDAGEAAKSEADKAIEAARKEGRKEAETELMGKASARLVRSEFILQAKDRNIVDPNSAYLLAKAEERFSGVQVKDDDTVEGMDDTFWGDLLKGRDYLILAGSGDAGEKKPPPGNANAGTGTGGRKAPPADRQEELKKAYPSLANRR